MKGRKVQSKTKVRCYEFLIPSNHFRKVGLPKLFLTGNVTGTSFVAPLRLLLFHTIFELLKWHIENIKTCVWKCNNLLDDSHLFTQLIVPSRRKKKLTNNFVFCRSRLILFKETLLRKLIVITSALFQVLAELFSEV